MTDDIYWPYHCVDGNGIPCARPPHSGIPVTDNSHKMAKQVLKMAKMPRLKSAPTVMRRIRGVTLPKAKKAKFW